MSSGNPKPAPTPDCHFCKEKHPGGEHPPPSGICPNCQAKIGVILLIIMVIAASVVFFGLI
jgi:hypothetical protein